MDNAKKPRASASVTSARPHSRAASMAKDPWAIMRQATAARIGLRRSGASQVTEDVLAFSLAHAMAKDAVYRELDTDPIVEALWALEKPVKRVTSQAADRQTYLLRPDLGRALHPDSQSELEALGAEKSAGPRISFVIADGLSAGAVQLQAVELLSTIAPKLPQAWEWAPICVATQARVALGDEVASQLAADLVVVLIGERPGLSSPDSMGLYLTYHPQPGTLDSNRNCISNIRPGGLTVADAASRLIWLMQAAIDGGKTGIELKDRSAEKAITDT